MDVITLKLAYPLAAVVLPPPRAAEESPPQPSPYDQHFVELDRAALDEAYRMQLAKLFGVWMADDHKQPARAITGPKRQRQSRDDGAKADDRVHARTPSGGKEPTAGSYL